MNRGENKTVIAALARDGIRALMRFDGGMTGARFEGYVRHVLAPTLRPGQVVIADNLRAHHTDGARVAIEARGARLLFLPPYSPDFNPIEIEQASAKLKPGLRAAGARTTETVLAATRDRYPRITATDARSYYRHAGYFP